MNELETEVAKIQIGNPKQATTHVLMISEEAPNGAAELFVVTELPMFNPAAFSDCEQIAQAVAATLRRSYRKEVTGSSFETALAHINEELGKLASIGKTHWVGKLNALVGVKHKQSLSLATTGKISALLFRDSQFVNISDSTKSTHPLKTFENFSVGKLKLNDIVILSTPQLLNHLSIDRLKNIIQNNTLEMAAEQAIRILEENAGPDVAFGTLIIQLVEPGSVEEESVDLGQYLNAPKIESKTFGTGVTKKAQLQIASALPLLRLKGAAALKQIKSLGSQLTKGTFAAPSASGVMSTIKTGMNKATAGLNRKKFQAYSKQKKFFMISAAVLLIALIGNIAFSSRYKKTVKESNAFDQQVGELEGMLNDADAALLYRDELKTKELLETFGKRIGTYAQLSETQSLKKTELETKAQQVTEKLEHKTTPQVTTVATLSNSESLVVVPGYIGTQSGDTIVSYNTATNATEDNAIRANESFSLSAAVSQTLVAIHNGTALAAWNPKSGKVDRFFSQSVPARTDAASLKYYATNNRVYTINKSTGQVMSFAFGESGFSKPVVSISALPNAAGASDLAIDSNVYVYLNGEVVKYNAGKPVEFTQPILVTPLSQKGKLATENGWNGLYILDIDNNRILIVNKNGEIIQSLVSPEFKNLKDFTVDEKAKTIYVLADNNLLKVNF